MQKKITQKKLKSYIGQLLLVIPIFYEGQKLPKVCINLINDFLNHYEPINRLEYE